MKGVSQAVASAMLHSTRTNLLSPLMSSCPARTNKSCSSSMRNPRECIGPYLSTEANVRTSKTRGMCYFSYEMMEPLLGMHLMTRQVFKLIVPVLWDAGLEATCGDLIIFLTISLVEPSTNRREPWTLQTQTG
jgi:hypothetical protein